MKRCFVVAIAALIVFVLSGCGEKIVDRVIEKINDDAVGIVTEYQATYGSYWDTKEANNGN